MRFRLISGLFLVAACGWADVQVCIVEPAPGAPGVPRLSMEVIGCQQTVAHPADLRTPFHTFTVQLYPLIDGPLLNTPTYDFTFPFLSVISMDDGPLVTGNGVERFVGTQPVPGLFLPYNTQMLQLDLFAPGGIIIHLDPGRPSLGTMQVQPLPGNVTQFTSFFDVFTEISVDGGQSFLPSVGAAQVSYQNAPEPAPGWLVLVAVCLMGAARLRPRRHTAG